MTIKILSILFGCLLCLTGCQNKPAPAVNQPNTAVKSNEQSAGNAPSATTAEAPVNKPETKITVAPGKQPRAVRDFFNLLPQKYFLLEGCEPAKDKNCEKARAEYVKNYLEVEDTANGYWKSGCDGAQSCLRMALFKRPDASYVVGVHTLNESEETNYFLEYRDGNWSDISSQVVPEFNKNNIYELPRYGTTVEVFKKNFPEPSYSERGAKIYALEWKDGKFAKK